VPNGNHYVRIMRSGHVRACARIGRGRLPAGGGERIEIVTIGHRRQAREHVAKISVRVFAVTTARDDYRVKNRRALAGVGMPDKQPVFLADGAGAYRVLNGVVVQTRLSVGQVRAKRLPVFEQIIAGCAKGRFGQCGASPVLREKMQPFEVSLKMRFS